MDEWLKEAQLHGKRRLIRRTVEGGHADDPAGADGGGIPTPDAILSAWSDNGGGQFRATVSDMAVIAGGYKDVQLIGIQGDPALIEAMESASAPDLYVGQNDATTVTIFGLQELNALTVDFQPVPDLLANLYVIGPHA